MFNVFDLDGDGTISKKEMLKVVMGLELKKEELEYGLGECNPCLARLDSEVRLAIRAFQEMDMNKDGRVTKEEFIATMQSLHFGEVEVDKTILCILGKLTGVAGTSESDSD